LFVARCRSLSLFHELAGLSRTEDGDAANRVSTVTTEASSALQGSQLREHLRQLEKYGDAGYRELQNGRIRYYGEMTPARTQGEMAGARLVREWNPATNTNRTWYVNPFTGQKGGKSVGTHISLEEKRF
jgi:hypothetical protein